MRRDHRMNVIDQTLDCLAAPGAASLPLLAIRPAGLEAALGALPAAQAAFLRAQKFRATAQELFLLPGPDGLAGAVLGLGEDRSPDCFGGLAFRLPEGTIWRLEPGDFDTDLAILGFCLGAYRFTAIKPAARAPARLAAASAPAEACAQATWMVRDLINLPANLLGPTDLANAAADLAQQFGATATLTSGVDLHAAYPMIAAVGAGSARPPVVARIDWRGSQAGVDAPLIALCGKGVVFDTGGYDLKPSAGMLRMKKDMGGAAVVLGIARMVMQADLPVCLSVRLGCAENSVSGRAMRPLDVVKTRSGLSVEIGNTDAEGRLVLCDLLAEASADKPTFLLDCAPLTGAARVALGPDIPALFCNDSGWAQSLLDAAHTAHDPLWRLPLWEGYDAWLNSPVADLNNVSAKPFAGAIIGALFLRRFVTQTLPWAHIDLYAWNDQTSPARPEGGEAQAMRAVFTALATKFPVTGSI